jgi:two-component system, probable response regulator PhcQ
VASNILIVDDEICVLKALQRALRGQGYRVLVAENAQEGLAVMERHVCQVVVCDQHLQGLQGTDFLTLVRKLYPATVRIMLTGKPTVETAIRSINDGEVYRFLTKPWDDRVLKYVLTCALAKFHSENGRNRQGKHLHRQKERLLLEKNFPGISRTNRDRSGCHHLEDISDQDLAELSSLCLPDHQLPDQL